jgi:DNA-directed RNA polymerase specialized sigma24 family protein
MAAWTEILIDHASRAYLVARRVTGDPSLSEDVVQETCVRLLGTPVPALPPEQLRGYLLRLIFYSFALAGFRIWRREAL